MENSQEESSPPIKETSQTSLSDTERLICNKAIGLLSRREHSKSEIQKKLLQKFPSATSIIQEVIIKLAKKGYLCEDRYKTMVTKSLIYKNVSNNFIIQKLKQESILTSHEEINSLREEYGFSSEHGLIIILKKKLNINQSRPLDKRRESAIRYAMSKGFSYHQISNALDSLAKDYF